MWRGRHCSEPEEVTLLAATAESADDHDEEDHEHTATSASNSTDITEVTGCHAHSATLFCFAGDGGPEWEVTSDIDVENAPEAYTGCHAHGAEEL